jgi:antitoxin CcdA
MLPPRQFRESKKRSVSLSLSAEAVMAARALDVNLSQLVNELLVEETTKRWWQQWNEENKEAIAAYNKRIEREGLPLARWRTFMRDR